MSKSEKYSSNPKPFVKWAGGKKQLLGTIDDFLPTEIKESKVIENYVEPFVGGGALFFFLESKYTIKSAYLSDINKDLILAYKVIKEDPKKLIKHLKDYSGEYISMSEEGRKKFFYNVRNEFNQNISEFDYKDDSLDYRVKRASQMIFLNKTCFNGLFRVNRKGEFNVPAGRSKNPLICDENNIMSVHEALKEVTIEDKDYSYSKKFIDNNSFVYLDPPYKPLNNTSSFNGYSKLLFDDNNQRELGEFYKKISENGAKVLLSNSDPKNTNPNDNFFDKIYADFNIYRVPAKRYINSKGDGRGPINEILVTNY